MGTDIPQLGRDKVIAAMSSAIYDRMSSDDPAPTAHALAVLAFEAAIKAALPKTATKNEANGTWWSKTATGDKMITRITVQI